MRERVGSDNSARPLLVVVVGAGGMGREWIRLVSRSTDVSLVGIVDLDRELASAAAEECGVSDVPIATSVTEMCESEHVEAVINVTVPQAHGIVNEEALRAGLYVLCEKPLAVTLQEAIRQVAVADATGGLLMVSQSRRYFNHLSALRQAVSQLGPIALVSAQFFHEDHEPGFREEMDDPLLVDMSIHHFDMLRFLSADTPVAVRCHSWNPPWSWFAGNAVATAEFELQSGARFVYVGSRCTPGLSTSWNAKWQVYAENGAAEWDGDHSVQLDGDGLAVEVGDGPEEIAGALQDFVQCIRLGVTPQNEVRHNLVSLAMVEGAVVSSRRTGERIALADLLNAALADAVREENEPEIREVLASWSTIGDVIASVPQGTHGGSQVRGKS